MTTSLDRDQVRVVSRLSARYMAEVDAQYVDWLGMLGEMAESLEKDLGITFDADLTKAPVNFDLATAFGVLRVERVYSFIAGRVTATVVFRDLRGGAEPVESQDFWGIVLPSEAAWVDSGGETYGTDFSTDKHSKHQIVEMLRYVMTAKLNADTKRIAKVVSPAIVAGIFT